MKATFFLSIVIGLLIGITHTATAQTKKIAWRSHAGSNTTFTFRSTDDFGLMEPSKYRSLQKRTKQDTITSDSLAVCNMPKKLNAVHKMPSQTKQEEAKEKREQRKAKRKAVRQEIKTLKKDLKKELKSQASMVPIFDDARPWLWCLLLPLALVFGVSLHKP
ncbi:MAG: hypothetical protein AB8E82_03615 [Aureispira sp.]